MNLKSDFLALLGLCALTIAHPILNTLGHGSTFFVAHGADSEDIIAFALVIYMLPALLIITCARVLQFISARAARGFIAIAVGILSGFWFAGLVSMLPAPNAIAIALVSGVIAGGCFFYIHRVREFLLVIGLLSPLVVISFLVVTPVKNLLAPEHGLDGGPVAGRQTPIVILLFDELSLAVLTTPGGQIDRKRLPNFARLERMSTWYDDTTTVSIQTEKAVPAILSGMRPNENTQPSYSEFPRNLFTLLAGSHTITAFETYTRLCPRSVCSRSKASAGTGFTAMPMYRDAWIVWLHTLLPREMAKQYLPSIANRWSNFRRRDDSASGNAVPELAYAQVLDMGKNQTRRFRRFVTDVRHSVGPHLSYLHIALPHVPWIYLPDGTAYNGQYAAGGSRLVYGWIDDQYLVDKGVLRYSLQVEYVDLLLGQMLDALQQSGRLNETLLIVLADHGVAFAPGEERRTPVPSTLAGVSRIPLFIKYPGQTEGVRDNRKIETIDILPTIADVLGLALSGDMDGQSIVSADWRPAKRHILEQGEDIPDIELAMDMRAASEQIYRVLTPGNSSLDAIGLASGKHFFGKPLPVPDGRMSKYVLQLDNSRLYASVDPDTKFLPARLTGTLKGARSGAEILLALNDKVAGSGMTYDDTGRVAIMLDPRAFQAGENIIRAFEIDGPRLLEIGVDLNFEDWIIDRNASGVATVRDDQGETYRPDDQLQGYAVYAPAGADLAKISGYACDARNLQVPKALLLVEGNTVMASSFHLTDKPDIAHSDDVPEGLGCRFSLDVYDDLRLEGSALSVLALFEGGRMLEIPLKMGPADGGILQANGS